MEMLVIKYYGISLLLGALIGLEREYASSKKRGHSYAGIRTFPLIALFGAMSAHFAQLFSPLLLIASLVILSILMIVTYISNNKYNNNEHVGATTEMATILTFFLGVLVFDGQIKIATLIAVVITTILYSRSTLHYFVKHISREEMSDTLKFAAIAFVILPFLPDKGFGPLGLFNPYNTWLMVVLISGIGFAGYILMKWFGEKGIVFAGLIGGLISSTATSMSFANRSRKEKNTKALVLGVLLANGVMFVRILIEVFVINRTLFWKVLMPLAILIVATIIIAYILFRNVSTAKGKVNLSSPFTMGPALTFAIFFAIIIALAKLANIYLATKGIYLVSFISGFADVDAITLSLSQLANGTLPLATAKNGIIIAAATNTLVKGGIAWYAGSKKFAHLALGVFSILAALFVALLFF